MCIIQNNTMTEYFQHKILILAKYFNDTTYVLLLFCLLFCIIVHKYFYRTKSFLNVAAKLPGPPYAVPFVGGVILGWDIFTKGFLHNWFLMVRTYKHPFHFWVFNQLWVVVSSPKDLETLYLGKNGVYKEPIYTVFGDNSEGIFVAEGQDWRTLRSLLNPAFHTKLMGQFLEVMVAKSEELVKILEPQVGKEINIIDYTGSCMLDIICGSQFGVPTDEMKSSKYEFFKKSRKNLELVMYRLFNPLLHPRIIFNSTSMYQQRKEYTQPMINFVKMIITKRKNMLESFHNTEDNHKKSKQEIYLDGVLTCFADADERSLIRKVTDVLIAGSDTTAVTSSYALLLLGMYPEVQEKVYQEQCEIFHQQPPEITIKTLSQMKYLEMVIKEVLRLYSAVGIGRKLKTPVKLDDCELPTGCSVYVSLFSLHRNPNYWSHPQEFYPDHFLPENIAARPKFSFLPFSAGPRNCPGVTFGYLSMKTVLATIVRNYKIHSDLKMADFKHKLGLMFDLKNGFPLTLSKR